VGVWYDIGVVMSCGGVVVWRCCRGAVVWLRHGVVVPWCSGGGLRWRGVVRRWSSGMVMLRSRRGGTVLCVAGGCGVVCGPIVVNGDAFERFNTAVHLQKTVIPPLVCFHTFNSYLTHTHTIFFSTYIHLFIFEVSWKKS
jgi:hypothetical protein